MANMYINNMTALWNNVGTVYSAIKMNVTNAGSAALSRLIDMQVANISKFSVDVNGNANLAGNLTLNGALLPLNPDNVALGSVGNPWSDLFLGTGGVINWANSDVTITHATDVLTLGGGTIKIPAPGNVSQCVVTTDAAQTLTNKTISGGSITGSVQFATTDNFITVGPSTAGSACGMARTISTGQLILYGGTAASTGAYLQLFGESNASNPRDIILGSEGSYRYFFDYSASAHYWKNNTTGILMSLTNTALAVACRVDITGSELESTLTCTKPSGAYYTSKFYGPSGAGAVLGYSHDTTDYGILGRYVAGSGSWSFYGAGPAYTTQGFTGSDARMKNELADCNCGEAYDKVRAIRVKSYRKWGSFAEQRARSYDEMGFTAQDIEQVIPEAVIDVLIPEFDTDARERMGGDYIKATNDRTLLAHLWAAFQHQAHIIENLEAKITALEARGT